MGDGVKHFPSRKVLSAHIANQSDIPGSFRPQFVTHPIFPCKRPGATTSLLAGLNSAFLPNRLTEEVGQGVNTASIVDLNVLFASRVPRLASEFFGLSRPSQS